ncbi:carbohydrate ABC transporter permease [Mycoplasma buteonis]|uniref:carbohydrate ABC transporter permease n=1 Tax=Mycoplasma buteonis TaxID=171280 RepID=UPI0005661D9D|nr:carbohydrate ABC transporter permease [Mycoplasma buteonis]
MFELKLKIQNKFLRSKLKKNQERVSSQVHETTVSRVIASSLLKILLLSFFGVIILFPFFLMLSISFMDDSQSESLKTSFQLLPNFGKGLTYVITYNDNGSIKSQGQQILSWAQVVANTYKRAFDAQFFRSVALTFSNVLVSVFFKILITFLMGYAFSLRNWRGKNLLWFFALALLVLPEVALLAGQYKMILETKLYKNWFTFLLALAFPFTASIFNTNMYRNAFEAIPGRIKEVSLIDGAGGAKYLFKIAFPMVMPTTLTIVILTSLASWNSYLWPQLISTIKGDGQSFDVMSVWLFNAGRIDGQSEIPVTTNIRLAAVVISIIPMFLAFLIFRKNIMRAISRQGSAIKG